jgi:hypothetical protein
MLVIKSQMKNINKIKQQIKSKTCIDIVLKDISSIKNYPLGFNRFFLKKIMRGA